MKDSTLLSFCGVSLLFMAGVAMAAPIVLDTEQKAAAGVATALSTSRLPREVNGSLDYVRDLAHFTLKTVDAATTPATLMGTPGGIAIGCSISGTVEAKMPNALPRILRLQWQECVTDLYGYRQTINGPLTITLPADTFQPQNVLAIRLGNATAEFRLQRRSETAEQNDTITDAFNIALNGDISLTRLFGCCEWVGTSAFEVRGYYDYLQLVDFPSGAPSTFVSSKLAAQRLTVLRTTNSVDGLDEDSTRYLGGVITMTRTDPPPYGVSTRTYRFNDYHVDRTTDYAAWFEQVLVNGRINVERQPVPGSCMNGTYAFQTRVPLVTPLNTQVYESGRLAVNGSVVASFYSSANTPPALPMPVNGMLLNMRVRDVGNFNYDADSVATALVPVGQCSP